MGLRSFIKNRFIKQKRGNNKDTNEEEDYWDKLRKETLEEVRTRESTLDGTEVGYESDDDEDDDDYNVYRGNESVEERIERIKSGGMTEDEKQAFLKTALDRTVSKGTKYTGPPIRQQVIVNKGNTSSKTTKDKEEEKPSPFPKDALWNTIVGNKKVSSYEEVKNSNDLLLEADEAKKREWYNMITNPNRFKSFSAFNRDSANAPPPPPIMEENDAVFDLNLIDETVQPFSSNTTEPPKDTSSPPPTKSESNTLSSRLEQAAILQTKLAKEKREENERLRLESEARYLEEQARIQAIRKQREEEVLERERILKEKKLAQQQEIRRQEEERKAKQLEQVRLLQLKQDEYWKQQLDKEKQSREAKMSEKEKKDFEMQQMKIREQKQIRMQQEKQQMFEVEMGRLDDSKREPKGESKVLDQAKIDRERAKELARKTLEASAAKVIQQEKERSELQQRQQADTQNTTTPPPTPVSKTMDWSKLKNPTIPSSPTNTQSPNTRLNLNDLTRYNPTTTQSPSPNKPIRQTIGSMKEQNQQPNKPIRMKLPIGEEDDIDTSSSIKEPEKENDAKKRASQWGINLDLLK